MSDPWATLASYGPQVDADLVEAVRQQLSSPPQPTDPYSPLMMTSPWATYSASYAPPGYTKDPAGIVHLRGLALRVTGTPTGFEVICTVPPGYRTEITSLYACAGFDGGGYATNFLEVRADGTVRWVSGPGGASTVVSFDTIHFRAAK